MKQLREKGETKTNKLVGFRTFKLRSKDKPKIAKNSTGKVSIFCPGMATGIENQRFESKNWGEKYFK